MIIVMQEGASEEQIEAVIERVVAAGFDVHRSSGVERTILGVVGVVGEVDTGAFEVLSGVAEVIRITGKGPRQGAPEAS